MKIRAARSDDLDAIKALLAENELPVADINAALLADFLVAEYSGGQIVGSVAVERFERSALLRSLAVARTARNERLGTMLLTHAELLARASDVSDLWLLTTTAAGFFRCSGYADVDRDAASAEMQASTVCPAVSDKRCLHDKKAIAPAVGRSRAILQLVSLTFGSRSHNAAVLAYR
ncbi:GNAT family N-acetyltransferase [Paraburkholderia strydomiana]|uniref:GNAT family N-acetyltransferase n=1 Tax=Paraburkholderia strydomiana TaxID=1245417 RepID=UPI0020358530|nr:GNAT family N-acetyltransferase [Paraburkholderia strydomiana]